MTKPVRKILADSPMTPARRRKLAELATRPDSEIDFSDLAPLKETFWKSAVRNPFYRPVKQQLTVRLDADVGRNPGQNLVAGNEGFGFGAIEAGMLRRVSLAPLRHIALGQRAQIALEAVLEQADRLAHGGCCHVRADGAAVDVEGRLRDERTGESGILMPVEAAGSMPVSETPAEPLE